MGIGYGRKDAGEYWKVVMDNQPIPEMIEGLIPKDVSLVSKVDDGSNFEKNEKSEPKHDVTIYMGDVNAMNEGGVKSNVMVSNNEVNLSEGVNKEI